MRMKRERHFLGQEARFAGLAALLERPDAPWNEVLNCLARWPAEQEPERAIVAVEAAVDRWPAGLRGLSRFVVQQLVAGEVRPYLRVLRALDLRRVWSVRRRDLLLARMIEEGGVTRLGSFTTRYDLGEELIPRIVRSIGGLRSLAIGGSGVSSDGARALALAPGLVGLVSLSLPNNHIHDDGAEALLGSPWLAGLRFLNLHGNRLSPGMVVRLGGAPQWRAGRVVLGCQRGPGSW